MGQKEFRRQALAFMLGAAVMAGAGVTGAALYLAVPPRAEPTEAGSLAAFRKTREIEEIIARDALREGDAQARTDMMYRGLMAGLDDDYAAYYTKEEYRQIAVQNAGRMTGIGVKIARDDEQQGLSIMEVTKGAPADRAGVKQGDLVRAVNGASTKDMTPADMSSRIRELDEDAEITLTVEREGEKRELQLTMKKEEIRTQPVAWKLLDDQIGYIKVTTFNGLTAEQFKKALAALQAQHMKGLVIDLRDNLGGLVSACCDSLRCFMPKGVLVYEQNRGEKETSRTCDGKHAIDVPVAVLVNGNTASASEMFTGAVQDAGVGTVVGTQTYGKGIEQNAYELPDGSVVKLTTTSYLTPGRRDIHGTGIAPDVVEEDEGKQLEKAVALLKDGCSPRG